MNLTRGSVDACPQGSLVKPELHGPRKRRLCLFVEPHERIRLREQRPPFRVGRPCCEARFESANQ
jgi:hypothetical protein